MLKTARRIALLSRPPSGSPWRWQSTSSKSTATGRHPGADARHPDQDRAIAGHLWAGDRIRTATEL